MKVVHAVVRIEIALPDCNDDLPKEVIASEIHRIIEHGFSYEERMAADLAIERLHIEDDDWGSPANR